MGLRDTNDLISMVSFTFTMRRHSIQLTSALLSSSRLAKFGWVLFVLCNACQRSRSQNLRRLGENSCPILTSLWTKVHEIFRRCRRPFVLSNALAWSFISRFVQKSFAINLEVVEKLNKRNSFFGPSFLGGGLFYGRLLARFIVHRLAKFGLVPFAGHRLRSLATNWNAEFMDDGYNAGPILARSASEATLRMPRPPCLIGRVAWSHWVFDKALLLLLFFYFLCPKM